MRFERLDALRVALSNLDSTAVALEAVSVPWLIGKGDALKSAGALVSLGRTQALDAATIAAEARLAPDAIESAQRAVRALGDVPMTQEDLRAAGAAVRTAVEDVRYGEYVARTQAEAAQHEAQLVAYIDSEGPATIVQRYLRDDPTQLQSNDWNLLAETLARRGGDAELTTLAREVADGTRGIDASVRRHFDAAQVAQLDDAAYADEAAALLSGPADELAPNDWVRLSALLDDPRSASALPQLPARVGSSTFAAAVRDLAQGSREADSTLQLAFDRFHAARLTPRQAAAEARELLDLHSTDLERHDWSRLDALLGRDGAGTHIAMPARIGREASFRTLLRDHASGARDVDELTQRYFDAFHARSMTPEQLARSVDELVGRTDDLTTHDWLRLRAYLDADPDATIIRLPRSLPGARSLDELAREGAHGYDVVSEFARYAHAGHVAKLTPTQVVAEADELIARGAESLYDDDLQRLGALVEADVAGRIGMPATLPGSPSFMQVINESTEFVDLDLMRYFEASKVARMTRAEAAAATKEILGTPLEEITTENWLRLEAIVRLDVDGSITNVPRRIAGETRSLDEVLEQFATGQIDYLPDHMRPWAEALRVTEMDDVARFDDVMRTLWADHEGVSIDEFDLIRLREILERTSSGPVARLPRQLDGARPFASVLDTAIEWGSHPDEIYRYARAWSTARMEPSRRAIEISGLLGRGPHALTNDDWARLGALLDGDVDNVVHEALRKQPRTRPFAELVEDVFEHERVGDDPQILRYFSQWRALDDGAFRSQLEASVEALAAGTATLDDLARIRTQRHRITDLAYGRSAAHQSLIGAAMLQDTNRVASLEQLREALQLIADNMPNPKAITGEARPLVTRTNRLVEKNIERLDGLIGDSYENHPDYAELGRIRENVQLIQRLRSLPPEPSPKLPIFAATDETESALRDAIPASDQQLAW